MDGLNLMVLVHRTHHRILDKHHHLPFPSIPAMLGIRCKSSYIPNLAHLVRPSEVFLNNLLLCISFFITAPARH
jgi:hypothetical protein